MAATVPGDINKYHKILYSLKKDIEKRMRKIEENHGEDCEPQDCIRCEGFESAVEYDIIKRLYARFNLKDIKSVY